ncbi:zinc ribbon domain-containing protein [Lachnospiraceae bacterium 54-53]
MKVCIACGMPMEKNTDYPGGDMGKDYCIYCAKSDGTMQSFEEKKAGTIRFVMKSQGFDEKAAEKIAEAGMRKLPAWKEYFGQQD